MKKLSIFFASLAVVGAALLIFIWKPKAETLLFYTWTAIVAYVLYLRMVRRKRYRTSDTFERFASFAEKDLMYEKRSKELVLLFQESIKRLKETREMKHFEDATRTSNELEQLLDQQQKNIEEWQNFLEGQKDS